jgi:uncharacterized membrane protein
MDTTEVIAFIVIMIAMILSLIYSYLRLGHRKNPSMQRKILDALIQYGCVENPQFTTRTATAREIAHLIYSRDEYMKDPNHYDLLTAGYLIDMEKNDNLGNGGEKTDNLELAVTKGHWYIKWNPPSE